MKKITLFLIFAFATTVFSQSITVDTSTYTVPQLVNSVLINSPCINATNVTWRTGTNFGSTNGIGYFQNTNPNFPIQSGVILTTGSAVNAAGPNTSFLSEGSVSWTGDTTLENVLAASGINVNSTNATVLEFDFVPLSSHFDFDFLFASEEYGNFQCQFSDAFAFLLTDLSTGVTTNLAVVPGTSDPISVVTVRDFLYNSSCPSVNSNYFGSYNGGSNSLTSAINFNGQTKVMNASAVLSTNVTYRIKLVIADRGDYQSDSAIFLSSNSFNIGQDVLGDSLTVANNSALCDGQTHVLNTGLDPAVYSFIWKKDGVLIPSQTGPTLSVTQTGNYEVTYVNTAFPCQTISDNTTIEFLAPFTSGNAKNLYHCNSGQAPYNFDLSKNTILINLGISPALALTYHATLNDANNNINPLPLNYTSAGNQTIYARINNSNNSCYIVKTFQLLLTAPPTATQPSVYTVCANDNPLGDGTFLLNSLNAQVLNGQSIAIYNVTYFPTLAAANAGTNQLANSLTTLPTTIYIKVKVSDDPTCASITSVSLNVLPLPEVDSLEDVITCANYTLQPLINGNYFSEPNGQGTPMFAGDVIDVTQTIYIFSETAGSPSCSKASSFKVVILKPEDLDIKSDSYCNSYTLPIVEFGEYHTAPNGGGSIIPSGTTLTTTQVVYFYFTSIDPIICILDFPFNINIINTQAVSQLPNVFDCTVYTLPALSFGNYFDAPGGTGNLIAAGTGITTSKTIYVYGQSGSCVSQSSFEVVIGINFPTSVSECAQYTLPNLIVGNYFTGPMGTGTQIPGGTIINTTQAIYVYAVTQTLPNCTNNYNFTVTIALPVIIPPDVTTGCENYTLPALAIGNYFTEANGAGTMLNAGDVLTSSQTIHIYLNDNISCQNDLPVNIVVNQRPQIDSRAEIDSCHSYTLTTLANGNYFTGPNGTGTMLSGGDILTTSQLIYIYANENGCTAQTDFQLNVFTITASQPDNVTVCDTYTLPALIGNNKYYTQPNGQYGTGTELAAGTVITTTQTIYVFIESGERINCTDEKSFVVNIVPAPTILNITDVTSCTSYTLPTLAIGNYFTQTGGNGTMLNAGDVITTNQTLYVYATTGLPANCAAEKSFSISLYNVDEFPNITSCENFILPDLTNGNYYNASGGTGGMIPQGTAITATKTIYIYGSPASNPSCSDESSFNVTIVNRPTANPVPTTMTIICDEDGVNDGLVNFDLTQLNATVLGTQIGNQFVITYFASLDDANSFTNAITETTLTLVYVRVSNALTPNCYDIKPIQLKINKLPEPTVHDGIICIDNVTGNLINSYTITSGIPAANHTFQWFDEQGLVVGMNNTYVAIAAGNYSLIVTDITTGCVSLEVFANVKASEIAILDFTVNDDFASNQVLTINAVGTGDYEYQLDNGNFQDSPVFDNVASGEHTITVRDKNGCGIAVSTTIIINYPKYFTPNGDGVNETWNINDLSTQMDSKINIVDRYGKFITQLQADGKGWDGTYNNAQLPADDYWFIVNYSKNGEDKEFKSHFALKR
jgi:gliding motility-associated-like protein